MRKNAALDTNSFLHFEAIENIDWPAVVGANEVGLVIFPSVTRELDKKKYDGTPPVRARAQAAISKLREPRQVHKKVLGAPAIVVDDDGTESLLCEKRSELIDQSAAIVWHGNLLARLR